MAQKTRYGIPVGDDGFVPESELLKHYSEYYEKRQKAYDKKRKEQAELAAAGDPDAHPMPRINLAKRDYDSTSDTVIPLKCTPEKVAAWWRDPSSCDVQDIDTAGPPKVNIPKDMTPEQKKDQEHIKVIASPSEEVKLRRELVMTYSPEDLKKIAATDPTYAVKPTGVWYTGRYVPPRTRIELDRTDGFNQGVMAHETSHLLRDRDKSRTSIITKACHQNIGIEESCTVAEQMARSDKPDYSGYYQDVAVYDDKKHVWRRATRSEATRMAEEDFMLFTYGRGKGLKGDEALRSVEENWSKSHISRLFTDRGMAINVMAKTYGNVKPVSMASPRTKKEHEEAQTAVVTNATAGKPGIANKSGSVQTTLFGRADKRRVRYGEAHIPAEEEDMQRLLPLFQERMAGQNKKESEER